MAGYFTNNTATPQRGTRGNVSRGMDSLYLAGQRFGDMAGGQGQRFARYAPQADAALDSYAGLLSRRATDSDKAGFINQRTAPVQRNFLSAQAGLSQNLAQRGISPNSSVNAGAQAVLEGQRAAALSQAQNDATNYFEEEEMGDAERLYALLSGERNQALSAQSGLLGQSLSADQAGLGYALQQQQMEQDERRRRDEMLTNLLGGAFSGLGGLF